MAQSHSNEIPSPVTQRHHCECYRKLQEFGIPLYIGEENDLYAENQKVIPYENAFRLPGLLKINQDVSGFPNVEENELYFVFEQMAQVLPNLSDFEQNVLSFWILDVFIEGLWTAQSAKMSHSHQKATLLWIAYFFNYIQKQNPSRRELFHHLKTLLFSQNLSEEDYGEDEGKSGESRENENGGEGYSKIKNVWKLPLPPDISAGFNDFKSYSSEEYNSTESGTDKTAKSSSSSPLDSKEEESDTKTNIKDMTIILEILYRIFGRLWVFLELQTVFHAMPPVEQVDLPFTLRVPKPLYRPEPSVQSKVERSGKRPSFSEKSFEEIETERQLHKNDYILPLQSAEESRLYLKQFSGQPNSDRSGINRNREERSKK